VTTERKIAETPHIRATLGYGQTEPLTNPTISGKNGPVPGAMLALDEIRKPLIDNEVRMGNQNGRKPTPNGVPRSPVPSDFGFEQKSATSSREREG